MHLPDKNVKISQLYNCLEILRFKENIYNEEKIRTIYQTIYAIIFEMEKLEDIEAVQYYKQKISENNLKDFLLEFDIELS